MAGVGVRLAVAEAVSGLSWVVLAGKGRVEEGQQTLDGVGVLCIGLAQGLARASESIKGALRSNRPAPAWAVGAPIA